MECGATVAGVDLRQLRYFVAVAEELHFSRAAARLNLAQSALSAQIRALEDEIGGPLLVRSTRRVSLTPAGEALLSDARELLASAEVALRRARSLALGELGVLRIAALGPAPGGILAPVLDRFGTRHPRVRVEMRTLAFSELVEGLRSGQADIAFLYEPIDEPDLATTPLLTEPRVAVMPSSHRLAGRESVSAADLRDETFITHPDSIPQAWRDFWVLVDEMGERPKVSPRTTDTIDEWLHLIGRGVGVDTCPALISRYYSWPEVAFVPLRDAAPARMVLARRADAEGRLIREFTELAVDIARTATSNERTPYRPPG
jgi:LysR family transcriptional regulator, benzoate and cis,cis-muconate-responsive activator of ben and cat genes